jgi:FkbH-like protein
MMLRQTISDALRNVLPARPGMAVIHSSLSGLVAPAEFTRWDALAALDALVRDGWTIALPAFTFSFCGGKAFDVAKSPSEVGALADWALEGLGYAYRTPHPIYSFVTAGPCAQSLMSRQALTTFGEGSAFEYFEQENATIVMLGCDWKYCTQFHRYEELAAVGYRHFKDFAGRAKVIESDEAVTARMYVRDLKIDAENDFSPAVGSLREQKAIVSSQLWRGKIEAASARDIAATCHAQLQENPLAYVKNSAAVGYKMSKAKQAESLPPLRIAVLGHSNVEHLHAALEGSLDELLLGRRKAFYVVPFGQLEQEVLSSDSGLRQFSPDISIFVDRLEDLVGKLTLDGTDPRALEDHVAAYGDMIARHKASSPGWTFIFSFAAAGSPIGPDALSASVALSQLNSKLRYQLAALDQLVWIDVAGAAANSAAVAFDERLWFLGRFPFSAPFTQRLAQRCAGLVLAAIGETTRAIVVDLDNTLWGGVLGEDGADALQLGGDYPGNAYVEFQRVLKRLTQRGMALTIASKNDADLALRTLDEHPAMEIRSGDVVAHRINWQPKWLNIRELCEELNLGLESVLFIDDNPVEREAVRRNLPGVKVLELTDDPTSFARALSESPWIASVGVTEEDKKRVVSYKKRATIEKERGAAASLEDFYASLNMTLRLCPLGQGNSARAVQLSQKTNQFNSTTRRYSKADLDLIVNQGGDVIVVGLADKFGGPENIGLLVLKPHPERTGWGIVDNYALSCRVLGRGLEAAILHWALQRASDRGWSGLGGLIIETERNTPVRGIFGDAGFTKDTDSVEWIRSTDYISAPPAWLRIDDQLAEQCPVLVRS